MFRRQLHLRLFGQAKKIGESDLVYVYLHKMVVVYQDAKEYPSFVNLYALIVQLPGVNEHESEFLNFSPIYEHYYKVNNLDVRMRNILENDLNNYFALSILVKNLKWKCSTPHETLEEFLEYSLNTNYKIKTSVTSQKMSNKNKRER
nr:conserved Plasmodium protein, unknown function [Plasmodium sp. DRC-Itaito]